MEMMSDVKSAIAYLGEMMSGGVNQKDLRRISQQIEDLSDAIVNPRSGFSLGPRTKDIFPRWFDVYRMGERDPLLGVAVGSLSFAEIFPPVAELGMELFRTYRSISRAKQSQILRSLEKYAEQAYNSPAIYERHGPTREMHIGMELLMDSIHALRDDPEHSNYP